MFFGLALDRLNHHRDVIIISPRAMKIDQAGFA